MSNQCELLRAFGHEWHNISLGRFTKKVRIVMTDHSRDFLNSQYLNNTLNVLKYSTCSKMTRH